MSPPVLAPVRAQFRALASSIVPEAAALDASQWDAVEAIIEEALATRPPAIHRQLRLFIRALSVMPLLRYGRPFSSLSEARRTRMLAAIEGAPALVLRRGFWGLRTLVYMGYYGRADAGVAIGYRASPRGWLAWQERAP